MKLGEMLILEMWTKKKFVLLCYSVIRKIYVYKYQ